jgi:hypothetical protein
MGQADCHCVECETTEKKGEGTNSSGAAASTAECEDTIPHNRTLENGVVIQLNRREGKKAAEVARRDSDLWDDDMTRTASGSKDYDEGGQRLAHDGSTMRYKSRRASEIVEVEDISGQVKSESASQMFEENTRKQRLSQKMAIPREVTEAEEFRNAKKVKDGKIWKLNAEFDPTSKEEMNLLLSWRRRRLHLALNEDSGKVVLIYVSEKFNVLPCLLACIRHGSNLDPAECSELEEVVVKSTGEEKTEMGEKIYAYEMEVETVVAEIAKMTEASFEKQIPSRLFPLEVKYMDHENEVQARIIGFEDASQRKEWATAMKARK